jgi:hypothetical protein
MAGKTRLLVTEDVRVLLEDAGLERVAEAAATGWRCWACDAEGRPGDGPASVVVLLDSAGAARTAVVKLAHPRCCPPGVIEAGSPLPRLAAVGMTALAAVVAGRPVLMTELTAPAFTVDRGERTDLAAGAMLSQGLHLIAAPWEPAPAAPGWLAAVTGPRAVRVTGPDGEPHYDGTLAPPPGWRQLVAAARKVELLTGVDGLAAIAAGADAAGALESAAAAGRLAGATIRARVTHRALRR